MLSAMGRISSGREPRDTFHPVSQVGQGHFAGFIQADAPEPGCPGRFRKPGAAAVRADVLPEELFHPLHALFVLDLGEGVFHRIHRVEVGEVQLRRRRLEFLAL